MLRRLAVPLLLLVPSAAAAAVPQLFVHRVEIDRREWPRARAYLDIVSATGGPMPAIGPDFFRVYESGTRTSAKILKVEPIEAAGAGASIVVVVQASGAMSPIAQDLREALSALIAGYKAGAAPGAMYAQSP